MQRHFWGRINGFLNCPISTRWTSRIAITPWIPWFILENWVQIKGGAIIRSCDIQIHLGLGLQPNNMAYSVPKTRPQATFRPIEQMIFINSYYATPSGSHPVICFWNKKVTARSYYLSVAQQCLGSIITKHIYWSGNISKATLTTPHCHLNIHLQLTILDLPLH